MFYSKQKAYSHVEQIEKDLVPAKVFSSMAMLLAVEVVEVVPVFLE